jgi:hypothetical protein
MFCADLLFPLIARLFPNWRPPPWAIDEWYGKWSRGVSGIFMFVDLALIFGTIAALALMARP